MPFRFTVLVILVFPLVFGTAARCEDMQRKNIISSTMNCDNPRGNEIRESRHVSAPEGKAFEKDKLRVVAEPQTRSFSEAAGASGCFLDNLDFQTKEVHTKSGKTVSIPILMGFDVRSHADCGSGEQRTADHMLKNEKINTTCSAYGSTFDLKDLE